MSREEFAGFRHEMAKIKRALDGIIQSNQDAFDHLVADLRGQGGEGLCIPDDLAQSARLAVCDAWGLDPAHLKPGLHTQLIPFLWREVGYRGDPDGLTVADWLEPAL